MPAVKKTSTAASKASTATPSVSAAVVATLFTDCSAFSRPHGRPPTKKFVKSSEFIDDEAEEAYVHLFNSFTMLIYLAVTSVCSVNISDDDDMKSVKRYILGGHL